MEDINNLDEWGFNFVRLGAMWPGLCPTPNGFNLTYLSILGTIVDRLGSKGIYTLLDLHQDLLSRKFCGEGAPDWAIKITPPIAEFPIPALLETIPLDSQGYPELAVCLNYTFARFYFSMAVSSAFENLYNDPTIVKAFGDFWQQIATYFAKHNYVAGYELINEPWPGDIFRRPRLAYEAGYADKTNLAPLYDYAASRIRQIDNEHIIFYEQSLIDFAHLQPGFDHVPGGSTYDNRSVYSYHIYCGPTDRQGEPSNEFLCELEEDFWFSGYIADYKRIGGGGMLTEWGNMPNHKIDINQINFITAQADALFQSWSWWQFKSFHDITTSGVGTSESFYDENGNLQTEKVKALSRTYAYAIAGIPTVMNFDPQSKKFNFQYNANTQATNSTEIYLNTAWHYPKGYHVQVMPSNLASWKVLRLNRIQVIHSPSIRNGQQINVVITAV